ncbi:MAG: S-layer homology domain-containing protein, partial [Chloroflexota bacterium]|nr:S-layer homology domain-containing protein [Chloroflexota bacterium]
GTLTNANNALNGMSYTPAANYNGPDTLTIDTNDQGNTGSGGALADNAAVSITVAAVNDAPQNTVPGTQTMDEGETLVFSQANGNKISTADLDAGSSPVKVTLTATNGSLTLASTSGLSFTTGDGTNDPIISFTSTITNANNALNGMSYTPTLGFTGSGSVSIDTNDQGNTGSGGAKSDTDTVSVTVNGVATETPTRTNTATRTSTSTRTATFTTTSTPTRTPTFTRTSTSTRTATSTTTSTSTRTATFTRTATQTTTQTATRTSTSTTTATTAATSTGTITVAATSTATATAVAATGTGTSTATANPAATDTATSVAATGTSTSTATANPAGTSTSTSTVNPVATDTATAVAATGTSTSTATTNPEATSTSTYTAVTNPTGTSTRTSTPTVTASGTSVSVQTATATPTACEAFTDVDPGDTFYEYINCLACHGVIGGFPDGTFRENASITRGQISKIVSNAAGFNEDPGEQIYSDVPPGSPFYAYINRLTNRGIVAGYPCPTRPDGGSDCNPENPSLFKPNEDATRGQMAKIVSNAAGFDEAVSGQFYADVPQQGEGSQFYNWIMRLTNRGVMSGYACGSPDPRSGPCDSQNRPYFRPGNTVTRGQAAKIVSNTFFPQCQAPDEK